MSDYEPNAYYEDMAGFLWRWSCIHGSDDHSAWFPMANTGPGRVPSPALPVRKVYGPDGIRVPSQDPVSAANETAEGLAEASAHSRLEGER